jgi:hypothetical protein
VIESVFRPTLSRSNESTKDVFRLTAHLTCRPPPTGHPILRLVPSARSRRASCCLESPRHIRHGSDPDVYLGGSCIGAVVHQAQTKECQDVRVCAELLLCLKESADRVDRFNVFIDFALAIALLCITIPHLVGSAQRWGWGVSCSTYHMRAQTNQTNPVEPQ